MMRQENINDATTVERNLPPEGYYSNVTDHHLIPGEWVREVMPDLPEECFKVLEPKRGEVMYVTKGDYLSPGGTAFLERLPCGHVMKTPKPNPWIPSDERERHRNMRLEAQIYEKIGENPRVPKIINWDPKSDCLMMGYLENGNFREYLRQNHKSVTSGLRLRWAKQAAEGQKILHAIGVVHCDVSPRNFLLDSNLGLKISDLGGASLLRSKPSAASGERFRAPELDWNKTPVLEDDIFSLGSLLYFIITGRYPYEEIASDEVEKLYRHHVFPDLDLVTCGPIIKRCWEGQVHTVQETCSDLEACEKLGPL